MGETSNINEILDGHVVLDLECLDRIYLNAYGPCLQVGGQVVTFLTRHLGYPIPSPALFANIGNLWGSKIRPPVVSVGEQMFDSKELGAQVWPRLGGATNSRQLPPIAPSALAGTRTALVPTPSAPPSFP